MTTELLNIMCNVSSCDTFKKYLSSSEAVQQNFCDRCVAVHGIGFNTVLLLAKDSTPPLLAAEEGMSLCYSTLLAFLDQL